MSELITEQQTIYGANLLTGVRGVVGGGGSERQHSNIHTYTPT